MIEVYEKKRIEQDCNSCLYKGSDGIHCAHADNHGKAMIFINGGRGCGYYWLDQNRFTRAY